MAMTAQVKFGDLLLCYGTAGKNLYTCFTDGDLDVVRRGEVRQQTTVSSGVLAAFTTDAAYASSADYERVQYERYHAWCEQHEKVVLHPMAGDAVVFYSHMVHQGAKDDDTMERSNVVCHYQPCAMHERAWHVAGQRGFAGSFPIGD